MEYKESPPNFKVQPQSKKIIFLLNSATEGTEMWESSETNVILTLITLGHKVFAANMPRIDFKKNQFLLCKPNV